MNEILQKVEKGTRIKGRRLFYCIFMFALFAWGYSLYAFEIPTGNEDVSLLWDNTLRITSQYRVANQDDELLASPNLDDGNRNFDTGFVSNRLDVLSELDLMYKRRMGVRVSGALWYDQAYNSDFDNDSVATSNLLDKNGNQVVNRLSSEADKYYAGPDGELLDAFVFTRIEAWNVPVYLKAGRHIYSWGQSLLNPIHAISYGQMPLDLQKGTAQPGIEAKELFRPTNMVSAVAQLTNSLQVAGQYYLEWERNRLPLDGTYFGASDIALEGPGTMIMGPGAFVHHGRDIEPDDRKDFGVSAQWMPGELTDMTFGFYYRRFSDRMPTLIVNLNGDPGTNPNNWLYHVAYKSDIDVFGLSYATTLFGASMGTEVSYRKDMPLVSEPAMVYFSGMLPDTGDILGATGDTVHVIFNLMKSLNRTALWHAGVWMFEIDYSRWLNADDPNGVFKGRSGYSTIDRVTEDHSVVNFNFSPQYLQVLPGLDIAIPLSVTYGLWGNSSVANGGVKGDGNFGIGIDFTYLSTYEIGLKYANYFGDTDYDPLTGVTARGDVGLIKDRDFIALTVKYTF